MDEEKRRHRLVAIANFVGVLALFLWGIILLTEKGDLLGWLPIFFAVVLSAAQIGIGLYYFFKNKG